MYSYTYAWFVRILIMGIDCRIGGLVMGNKGSVFYAYIHESSTQESIKRSVFYTYIDESST